MVLYDNFLEVQLWRLLKDIDPNISEETLKYTPNRWINAMREMTAGYQQDPEKILSKEFDEKSTGMVIDKGIPFYSTCAHHLMPFHGQAAVGYIPDGKVVGLSKIPRLVECFAKRLQIQEAMTDQIADAMDKILKPKGVMVVVEATHTCACARGIKKENVMVTSALRGAFETPAVRSEFLQLISK